ncbi:GAP family protein [Microbacterium sp. ISL-108]|nr:GAP family protein [Microbacterium sp. ISL-108]
MTVGLLAFSAADTPGAFRSAPWVPIVHAVIGVVCTGGALWTFFRARLVVARVAEAHTPDELTAATPQLPGLVRSVERFTPGRSFLLGFGIFLTPMNIALVAAAAIGIVLARLPEPQLLLTVCGFLAAAAAPVAIPVFSVLARGEEADPMLRRLRRWMLHRSGFLTAAVLLLVGVLQFVKALQGWFS